MVDEAPPHIRDALSRIKLPTEIRNEDLSLAKTDAEILAARLRDRPDDMRALLAAVHANERAKVTELLKDLKITESDVKAEGGGFWWIIVVVVLLYATDAY